MKTNISNRRPLNRRTCLSCTVKATAFLAFLTLTTPDRFAQADVPAVAAIRVACVGDSITQGVGIKDAGKNSYPAQLGQVLGEDWDVRNFGQSRTTLLKKGDFPYVTTPQYEAALAFKPDVVVIKLGTNDTKPDNWVHWREFVSDYVALIESFQALESKPQIWVCYPVPVYQDKWGINDKGVFKGVVPLVDKVAKQTGARVINLYLQLSDVPEMFPDKIHPNADGAGMMARVVADHIGNTVRGKTDALESYNLGWKSPSENYDGTMPIGNGELAANVHVERNGDLVALLAKTDSWSPGSKVHSPELLKLGRVRMSFDPPLFEEGVEFRQELDLANGTIRVHVKRATGETTVAFWIDANNPVVNVEVESSENFNATAVLETWRTIGKWRRLGSTPDIILPADGKSIRWYQRNESSTFAETFKQQHLSHVLDQYHDPLLHLTFGGLVEAEGMVSKDAETLVTEKPVKQLALQFHALTAQTEKPEGWTAQLEKQAETISQLPLSETYPAHQAYWANVWDRSWVYADGDLNADATTQAYVLQRWVQACAGRGVHPIKFNGSLFTVQGGRNKENNGPDYRTWGGAYWFQNTRLMYWPMLTSGDFDMMQPLFKMYRDAIPLLKERTKHYFKHDGLYVSETMQFWGLARNIDYAPSDGFIGGSSYTRYYWSSGLELSKMMIDYYSYTQDDAFIGDTLLPFVDQIILFYDQHFPRNADGTLHITPAASLETWHVAEDPMPEVAGLQAVLQGLLGLPESVSSAEQRKRWKGLFDSLPAIPVEEVEGVKQLAPAASYSENKNGEAPELYAVFPYRVFGIGKDNIELAQEAWKRIGVHFVGGWKQTSIYAAMLGQTEMAQEYLVKNVSMKDQLRLPNKSRFPAFWGPNFDYKPDQCHASVIQITLQRMLMQCDPPSTLLASGQAGKIHLLPAWPKEWNASFKLHAPHQTVVEGRVENGTLIDLTVTPASRKKDVVIHE